MTSGDLIFYQSEKMIDMLSNELNESNRMLFLHIFIPRSLLFRCGHFVPHPQGEGGRDRHPGAGKEMYPNDKSLRQCLGTTFDGVKRNLFMSPTLKH